MRRFAGWSLMLWLLLATAAHATQWTTVGVAKQDITPNEKVRLSGYASRDAVMTGVRDRLFVRCMAIGEDNQRCLLVSIEGISVSAAQTQQLVAAVEEKHGVTRSRIVVCSTHSHAAPHIWSGLTNLFRRESTEEEVQALVRYLQWVHDQSLRCISEAIKNQTPARLSIGEGEAGFAVHRRVIKEGAWTGFGVSPVGPVDRRVHVLVAHDKNDQILGAAYQYACHCTTLGPKFNEVTGDWAGLAARELEAAFDSTVFVPVIGCGADANPEPRNNYDAAVAHGKELAQAVRRVLDGTLRDLPGAPEARFGYAGLSAELPDRETLTGYLEDSNVNRQRWARAMLDTWKAKGRLPESYPAPIHTWVFGDQLAWVFLGGEVVVEYQMRLEKELDGFANVWVAAYSDDVFAYVSSERMRSEGGYEVDFSMVYYNQPGRWQVGTEDLLCRRVHEVLNSPPQAEGSKSPEDSLSCLRVPDGFQVDLVAAEPLVTDPINLSFAADGSVWVVEMGDYPLGSASGGKVKRLVDEDGDGTLDRADTFLDGLSYPTSATPWRDGVIVIAAPRVFFARDTDGDGVADQRETLLSGIGKANPQHRASGFDWGLDGQLYLGAGDDTEQLYSRRARAMIRAGHRDLRWDPDSGAITGVPGATQFIRSRDRWGRWFGNTNSVPLFQYPIDDLALLARNPGVAEKRLTLDPGVAPPVFPTSRTVDRFNDLFAHNRFTSACSSILLRGDGLGSEMLDAALVCEPVHNLVARFNITDSDGIVRGERFPEDAEADWFTSTDTWFRPVRAVEAPDGSVWVVDMYRRVIEHPQWIPDAWQERVDVRSGETAGRIYRISRKDHVATEPDWDSDEGLLKALTSPLGVRRDMAMQQILWHDRDSLQDRVRSIHRTHDDAAVRLQALGTLYAAGWATEDDWQRALSDSDARVIAWALNITRRLSGSADIAVREFATRYAQSGSHSRHVDSALILALGSAGTAAPDQLSVLMQRLWKEPWALDLFSLSSPQHASRVLQELLDRLDQAAEPLEAAKLTRIQNGLEALWESTPDSERDDVLEQRFADSNAKAFSPSQLTLALVAAKSSGLSESGQKLLREVVRQARDDLRSDQLPISSRIQASQFLGSPVVPLPQQLDDLDMMLQPDQPGAIRKAALAAAYRVKSPETAKMLIEQWKAFLPDERRLAGTTLLQRPEWTRALVDALSEKRIQINELDASTINGLQNDQNYRVMKQFGSLLSKPSPSQRKKLIEQYVTELDNSEIDPGEAARIYKTECATCHEPREELPAIGPALANLKKWSPGQWVSAVLDPNATVEAKYKQYRALTKSGQVFAGLVISQTDDAVQLALSDGRRVSLDRSEIETLEDSGVSLMPEGLEAKLKPHQLAGIIRYLRSK